jgi:trans-aconitate 2-methyltransferase
MSHTHEHAHGPHHSGHAAFDDERIALMIGAEGESAGPLTAEAIGRATAALDGRRDDVRRVADLGCGPAVEACALATAFPAALIVALDGSPAMRAAAQSRVGEAGLAARVEVGAIDLDGDLSSLGAFDLAWTAQALHHLRDEAATLARIAALLRPGGVLCVLERLDPAELVASDDLGRAGLWERVVSAQAGWHAGRTASAPAIGAEGYAALVAGAGLEVVDAGPLRSVVTLAGSPGAALLVARYVQGALRNLTDRLDPADVDALCALDGERSARMSQVEVRQSRTLVIGRAPGA